MIENSDRGLRVSLVATVLNEYGSMPAWLGALRTQTRYPDEFIVVDGGSDDGTIEWLRSAAMPFPLVFLECPGSSISHGRNVAISRTSGDIVVVTDAGTRAEPTWLAGLLEPFERDPSIDIVAGFFQGVGNSVWTKTLVATTLPAESEVDPSSFLASSRSVAIRRTWLVHGFQYPEWLDYCEDVVLDLQLRRAGAKQHFAPDAMVHFEPRSGPVEYFRQYFRYARGDGKAGLFLRRHVIRYATYLGATIVLRRRRPLNLLATGLMGTIYIRANVARFRQSSEDLDSPVRPRFLAAVVMIAMQRLIGDVAKMVGYPAGLCWRVRRDRNWRVWKTGWAKRLPSGDLPRF